ncbi:MAG TPA: penicillin acylase family protein, partial [Candidatus Polarisedimenticolaceae bacterium]|nr:penicillin acylase family protein [Candidatus Polarisedimenticolaceae bacterium]
LLVPTDRANRIHRFRALARRELERLPVADRALLDAYAAGVNAGLGQLAHAPPEYLALRGDPAPWLAEDSILVVLAMYFDLQFSGAARETAFGVMHELLPAPLVDFLLPCGSLYDAPLEGPPCPSPPVPGPDVLDLRTHQPAAATARGPLETEPLVAGSNNWAVAGRLTAAGGALLSNDMHLGLGLPNIWYRASLVWTEGAEERRVTGVMLPGVPAVVAGSTGRIAWGFTNSHADTADVVLLETDPADPSRYRTPQGWQAFEHTREVLRVHGAPEEALDVVWTVWGPVLPPDALGRTLALRWIAHDPGAANLSMLQLEQARNVDEAVALAPTCGIPLQNFVVVDRDGRIAWTLMGPLPHRLGFDGRMPQSWADGSRRWEGRLDPAAYPRIVDPPWGRLWTANNRVIGGEPLALLGDGGYDQGPRAQQIRDDLLGLDRATERDLLAIQLDDRARLIGRWRELLLAALTPAALTGHPRREELRQVVEHSWTGRASIDSAGYRATRAFREALVERALGPLLAPCRARDPKFRLPSQPEEPLRKLIEARPPHLLDPQVGSWEELLLAAADQAVERLLVDGKTVLAERTWGERNVVRIRHPLSFGVPRLARWLDLAPVSLPGDAYVPRVQGPDFGASERMTVSPGHEERGYLHMPGGESGHFLSPYYRKGHEAWERGEPTAFLPGPAEHRLELRPMLP